ncbi:MAG: hypothetical protein QOE58_2741 [Actinomycetota bacterium]|nr:hypothetical protein [Actinomycetota bacterium]
MTGPASRSLLAVHVLVHSRSGEASELATTLVRTLHEDPEDLTAHGLRIPVRIWPIDGPGCQARFELELAARSGLGLQTAVVVLIDEEFLADPAGQDFVRTGPSPQPRLLLPVALWPMALQTEMAAHHNAIRAPKSPGPLRGRVVLNRILHAAYRLLAPTSEALRVFVSHAKVDGELVAQDLRTHLHQGAGVRDWFDVHDIPHGEDWDREIRQAAERSLMLVVRSDVYAAREWCRIEALTAKRAGVPVVVLDSLSQGEQRSFPYLGNGPTIRLGPQPDAADWEGVLSVLLLEALRFTWFPLRIRDICSRHGLREPDVIASRPPELLSLLPHLHTAARKVLVYPDPPLGAEELALVRSLNGAIEFVTPTRLLRGGLSVIDTAQPLKDRLVGLSGSPSPDLSLLGLTALHLDHAFVELARQLLAAGARLAYGGDLRREGFTDRLLDLLATYSQHDRPARERVSDYLAWPLAAEAPAGQLGRLRTLATLVELQDPGAPGSEVPPELDRELRFATSLTQMRQRMTADLDARIMIAGRVTGFKGRYPGMLEEALLAVRAGLPTYLIGGFGGCTAQIIDLVQGRRPADYGTEAWQQTDPGYGRLLPFLDVDEDEVATTFEQTGPDGLHNGLSTQENLVLFEASDIDDIIALVLRGLGRLLH